MARPTKEWKRVDGDEFVIQQLDEMRLRAAAEFITYIRANADLISASDEAFKVVIQQATKTFCTQQQLAEKVDLTSAAISRWASGAASPPAYGRPSVIKLLVQCIKENYPSLTSPAPVLVHG